MMEERTYNHYKNKMISAIRKYVAENHGILFKYGISVDNKLINAQKSEFLEWVVDMNEYMETEMFKKLSNGGTDPVAFKFKTLVDSYITLCNEKYLKKKSIEKVIERYISEVRDGEIDPSEDKDSKIDPTV